jgi:hypothetical protein
MAFRPTFFVGGNGMSPFQVSKMTDDEIVAVVQAHKEGKQIQLRCSNIPEWTNVVRNEPRWNFEFIEYRVAPEPRKPREWTVFVTPDKQIISWNNGTVDAYGLIRVREVMDNAT